jgi:hypothetical protein
MKWNGTKAKALRRSVDPKIPMRIIAEKAQLELSAYCRREQNKTEPTIIEGFRIAIALGNSIGQTIGLVDLCDEVSE